MKGHVVFLPNTRGSVGQGWAFSEAVYRDWRGGDLQDVMDGVDLWIEKGVTDQSRLGNLTPIRVPTHRSSPFVGTTGAVSLRTTSLVA
jgi:hypothetical protein